MHGKVCTLSDCCPVCSAPGNAQGSFLFFLNFITYYGVFPLGSVLMADHAIYPVSLGTGSQGTFCGSPECQRAGPHSCHAIEEGVVVALRSGQAGFLREGRLIWALTQISNSISDGPSHSTSALVPGAQDCVLPADTASVWNRSPVSESPDKQWASIAHSLFAGIREAVSEGLSGKEFLLETLRSAVDSVLCHLFF